MLLERGSDITIPHGWADDTCPITALKTWLELSEIAAGPRDGDEQRIRPECMYKYNVQEPDGNEAPLDTPLRCQSYPTREFSILFSTTVGEMCREQDVMPIAIGEIADDQAEVFQRPSLSP